MTIEQARTICYKVAEEQGFVIDFPIEQNNRLKTTLGRVRTIYSIPVSLELSGLLLKTGTDESITGVILHELAHVFVAIETGEDHGHDATFKAMCARLGTDNDTISTKIERTVEEDKLPKYALYCSCCGKFVGGRARACDVTKYPQNYTANCCEAPLTVVQNW